MTPPIRHAGRLHLDAMRNGVELSSSGRARTGPPGWRSGTISNSPEPGGELAIARCGGGAVVAMIQAAERSIETRQPVTVASLYETELIEAPIHV
jgi:hypothetical protein